MELNNLRYFCVIAECESITKAAEILHISQPALSKTLRNLQEELGVALFDHVGRRIVLNANGKQFYSSVSSALDILDGAVRTIQESSGILKGSVSILTLTARSIIPEFIADFHKKYPEVRLELANSESESFTDLRRYDYCLSDILESDIPKDCAYTALFREEFILCCASHNPLAKNAPFVDVSEISNYTILSPWRGKSLVPNIKRICHEAGFSPKDIFECDNTRTLIAMIKEDVGVSLMPISTSKELLDNGLTLLNINGNACYRTIFLLHNSRRRLSDTAVMFEKEIRKFFSDYRSPNIM